MNAPRRGRSPGRGLTFPDVTTSATSGQPWLMKRASSKPLSEPGMSTSVHTTRMS